MDIHFKNEIAKIMGVNGAIVFENFVYWIRKNKVNDRHFYDGEYWTYNKIEAFGNIFDFWSTRQIRTILDNLRKDGYLKTGNYNKKGYDRTLWYTFTEKGHLLVEKYYFISLKASDTDICQKSQMDLTKKSNGFDKKVTPIPNTITNTISNTNKEKIKLTSIDKLISEYTSNSELIETLKDFLKMRKSIKKPMTDRAVKLLLNKLTNLSNDNDNKKIYMLNESIEHSWSSIYEPKNYQEPKKVNANNFEPVKANIDNNFIERLGEDF